ncbi:hypothetical protein SNE40_012108 [Patella caerulea]|uniref:EF-hand domain-containing protein n=1 Tax=Patella caerulea TaxID=87958 RepID=A0AAN8JPP9_PATCE
MGNKLGAQGRDGPENLEDLCKKYHFDKKEIKEWIAIFSKHCGDKKFLTQQEFCEVYNMTFCGDPGPFTKHVFRTFDLNKNGLVDVKEFLTGIGCSTSEDINTKLEWAFAVYDINGDGFITKAEIVDITYVSKRA